MAPTPITIITGFLGSGKTTILINLIPQLPKSYRLALLKNEFGDVAIDSELASSSSISGVQEMLNGCICCNLVGQLGDALETLRTDMKPDRIFIETSGSAFPATLALEVNRISKETNGEHFSLDGVISVIDVENWEGYDDTSVTAKMQAQYTDLVIFNKWEDMSERRFDDCLDRLGDLDLQIPWVKSARGTVGKDLLLGIDGALARGMKDEAAAQDQHDHSHDSNHQSEVEVLSVTLPGSKDDASLDLKKLDELLSSAPKDEIYRIKAVLYTNDTPVCSTGEKVEHESGSKRAGKFILNWAFGRWTFTLISGQKVALDSGIPTPPQSESASISESDSPEPTLRMTIVTARYESTKWRKRIEQGKYISDVSSAELKVQVERLL